MKSPAQLAYEAYCKAFPGPAGVIAVLSRPWASLDAEIKDAWLAVALALGAPL